MIFFRRKKKKNVQEVELQAANLVKGELSDAVNGPISKHSRYELNRHYTSDAIVAKINDSCLLSENSSHMDAEGRCEREKGQANQRKNEIPDDSSTQNGHANKENSKDADIDGASTLTMQMTDRHEGCLMADDISKDFDNETHVEEVNKNMDHDGFDSFTGDPTDQHHTSSINDDNNKSQDYDGTDSFTVEPTERHQSSSIIDDTITSQGYDGNESFTSEHIDRSQIYYHSMADVVIASMAKEFSKDTDDASADNVIESSDDSSADSEIESTDDAIADHVIDKVYINSSEDQTEETEEPFEVYE